MNAARVFKGDPTGPLQVFKFGGTSVGTPAAIMTAVRHVAHAAPNVVAVVSAAHGTTDLLLGAAKCALHGEDSEAQHATALFETRHLDLIRHLIDSASVAEDLLAAVQEDARELRAICQSIGILKELTPRTTDAVVARGERMLARIFAAALAQERVPCRYVDATHVIHTAWQLGSLWPDFTRCTQLCGAIIKPLLARHLVPVVPGYIGQGPDGEVVTLGRGGSDFSAAILARSLRAKSVTLFKEVDGIMTADPRFVPEARVVPQLHYREAAELAYYGAKVLHPRTMIPLMDEGIPLYLRNTFNSEAPGTRVAGDVEAGSYPVRALTAFLGQALMSVEGKGLMGVPGVAARTFTALSNAGHSVSMISQASSEASICFLVPEAEADHAASALTAAFSAEIAGRLVDAVKVEKKLAAVAVVGMGMRGTPGVAARTLGALAAEKINLVALAQGSSELNITMVVRQEDVPLALGALHKEYQLDRVRPLGDAQGRQAELVLLGMGQIARALVRQSVEQISYYHSELGLTLKTVAVADRSGMRVEEAGFGPDELADVVSAKASGAKLFYHKVPKTRDAWAPLRDKIFKLPLHQPILVDLTAAETAPLFLEALAHGFHIVTANKKPLAAPQAVFDEMLALARERGLHLRYEATVGAGLPVLDTLHKLKESGDEVDTILGCLSGTLGFLMTQLEEGVAFSVAVTTAHAMGYTEPDPREDLSGMDVARKALILARTLGLRADLTDVTVGALFPQELSDADPKKFLRKLESLDGDYAVRVERARKQQKVLRYVARISKKQIAVGLEPVPNTSPLARLHGTDNQVVIHTRRYQVNPLVVTGPGAGADVTASGVLNDIVAIAAGAPRLRATKLAPPALARRKNSKAKA